MPRKARLNVPGAVYHVMGRCLDHLRLFTDDEDRERFLILVSLYLKRTDSRCYAWALMNSHYHLVLRPGTSELWELMKPLNMHYARYHREKTNRRGPLFMDRFKSIITQDQNYVQELVRYVHLNPVRAGVCRDLRELEYYRWSGHGALMGRHTRIFQDIKAVLRRFGSHEHESRISYVRYLQEGLEGNKNGDRIVELVRSSNSGIESGRTVGCWVIGDKEFEKKVIDTAEAKRLRISRFERDGRSLEAIATKICRMFTIPLETLKERHRGGGASDARKAFAYIAAKEFKAPASAIGGFLGVGSTAISAMVSRGREIVKKRKIVI